MPSQNYVALLRAINVGGNNKLPMKDLKALLEGLGCSDVQTYIQSGNAVFKAEASLAARLPKLAHEAILKKYKVSAPVIVRSAAEIAKVVKSNPYLKAGVAVETLHVGFLAERPKAAAIALLDPQRSPGDKFSVLGSEVYFQFAAGVGKTKLTNQYFDSKLGTTITLRNWKTVTQLLAMTAGKGD